MTVRILLCEADQKKLGAPADLVVDFATLTQAEAEILDEHGVDPDNLGAHINPRPALGPDGAPLHDDDGGPRLRLPLRGVRTMVWMGLRRAGVDIPYGELDFERMNTRILSVPKDDVPSPTESPSQT
jgi:hypothetical protein